MNSISEPKVTICFGPHEEEAKRYVVRQVFDDWLGVTSFVEFVPGLTDVVLFSQGRELARFPDLFFRGYSSTDGRIGYPEPTITNLEIEIKQQRVSCVVPYAVQSNGGIDHIDILGSIFFILVGLEEYGVERQRCDEHERIPDELTWPVKMGVERIPVVDCLVHVLSEFLKAEAIDIKGAAASFHVTCDVDYPVWNSRKSLRQLIKALFVDLLWRKEGLLAIKRLMSWVAPKRLMKLDPYFNLSFMAHESLRRGLQFEAYLLSGRSETPHAGNVWSDELPFLRTIDILQCAGVAIGHHVSYSASSSLDCLKPEIRSLNESIKTLGDHETDVVACRSHYLRWVPGATDHLYERAGFRKDSTIAFSKRPGYRRGTSRTFRLFDPVMQRSLGLEEQPLLIMDVHVVSSSGKVTRQAFLALIDVMNQLFRFSSLFETPLTILFHNSTLQTAAARRLFIHALDVLKQKNQR